MPAKEYVPWVATAIMLRHSLDSPAWITPGIDTFAGLASAADALSALVHVPAS